MQEKNQREETAENKQPIFLINKDHFKSYLTKIELIIKKGNFA